MKILFWLLFASDRLALFGWFVIGVGFVGSSQVYTARLVNHLLLPIGLQVGSAILFVFAKSPMMRGVAFVLALTPVFVLYLSYATEKSREIGVSERALEAAIEANDFSAVCAALRDADVNKAGSGGVDPLTRAMDKIIAMEGNVEIVRVLLEAGAKPNGSAEKAVSPLERAIEMTKHHGTEPMMLLLKAGAKPNAKQTLGDPVFFAAADRGIDPSVMKSLVEHGANLRMTDGQGKSVLDLAILRENQPVVAYLIQQGVASGRR